MLYWLARRPARRIAAESCDPAIRTLVREMQDFGARVELYVLDVGTGIPTVVCLGLGDGRSWPGTTIGLCAHADPEVAIQRAVLEHGHYGAYIRRLMLEGRHATVLTAEHVVTALDHALYYVPTTHLFALKDFRGELLQPLTMTELRRRYQQEATLEACVSRLREASIRTAVVDVTSPDVGLTPVRVARAFGRYMQPIHFGFSNRRLANPRLRQWLPDLRRAQTEPHPIA
jgi:ribosomal protein S12 methylthiotransferase accessory factor